MRSILHMNLCGVSQEWQMAAKFLPAVGTFTHAHTFLRSQAVVLTL